MKGGTKPLRAYKKKVLLKKQWEDELEDLTRRCEGVYNPRGTVRTIQENKLFILALKATLEFSIILANADVHQWGEISWTKIIESVAKNFKVDEHHIREVKNFIMEDENGYIVEPNPKARGAGSEEYPSRSILDADELMKLVQHIDNQHSEGRSVTRRSLLNWTKKEFHKEVSKATMTNYLKKLGLCYRATKPRKRTLQYYRITLIHAYLIKLDDYYKRIQNGENIVLVFMDESYVHNTHALKNSWVPQKENHINKSASKGRRLVIVHAISQFGPLTEKDENGKPVCDLEWKKDSCASKDRDPDDPSPINCETLWVAQNKTGDYHDNMNSKFFMKWVKQKLLPCFERLHQGKKMVLVADNAPYHHSREIGSLSGLKKIELVDLMEKWECNEIELPLTDERLKALEEDDVDGVTDYDSHCVIEFNKTDFKKRKTTRTPFIPTVDELQLGFAKWLKENKPEALECKVERLLKERGYDILWTPPYCPDLQPIETFWGIGKNRVASRFYDKRTMRDTVKNLQEGWYGNYFGVGERPEEIIKPVNCEGLVKNSIEAANKIFIPMCKDLGLSGSIGNLVYTPPTDAPAEEGTKNFPIDLIVGEMSVIAEGVVDDSNE